MINFIKELWAEFKGLKADEKLMISFMGLIALAIVSEIIFIIGYRFALMLFVTKNVLAGQ